MMGRPPRLTLSDLKMIWVRYNLYRQNLPGRIAADYGITDRYVSAIGKHIDPCQPRPLRKQLQESRSTSSPKTSNGQRPTGATVGPAR